ncbi:glutamate-1-semialdehyde-2,1-aminomutase [Gordonibacter sp. An230]|uniref:glutamate-1-semialdehyde 2,1-aminomutase n=1 Tax=Gordonibacter sp. An230 TaxID=1965592 RepID=UPI000B3A16A3|nr:glutamate-1-semialdehyde 2,1-aminomutase [Gordonibacter sp. An230]OUO92033.1 glutamate-1-semialdehyde-2,1-aminomutase [Gordonibacter sp. An230]
MLETCKSDQAYRRACQVIPGGVDSPVRAARAVGRTPLFLAHGEGAHVQDVDGNRYVDYVGSWGPLICGHAHPEVVEAVCRAAQAGCSFGAPTEAETELALEVRKACDAVEMVRFVNSGTEATMSALRLARAATGRDYIVKFEGCYHGHSDGLLVKAGSGALTNGVPSSAGVPADVAEKTLVARYNDSQSVADLFDRYHEKIAAVIVEPVAGNMGVVPPDPGFLLDLRALTLSEGAVLIFDEVMTGFRVDRGGAVRYYGVLPDLVCLGKVIGGGLPLAAFGGRAELMRGLAPEGPVYQAGTLSGNPLAVAAGLATLRLLQKPGVFERLVDATETLAAGIEGIAGRAGVPVQVNRVGAMFSVFFSDEPVTDYESACASDSQRYARYYRAMLEAGVYLAPSQYEAAFMSTAHTDHDIAFTLEQVERVMDEIK